MIQKGYTHKLCVSKETQDLIRIQCIEEFLTKNPSFRGMNITDNFIVNRIARYYLEQL